MLLSSLLAQYQPGWYLDPYAGTDAAWLQPAAGVDNPYDWDISLVGVGGFISNDYAFLARASGVQVMRSFGTAADVNVEENRGLWRIGADRYAYDYYPAGNSHYGRAGVTATGPTFSFRLGEYTRIGFQSRMRFMSSATNLDNDFNWFTYNEYARGTRIEVDETYGVAAWWGEVGLHFSQAIPVGDGEWRFGVNARRLTAFDAASVYSPGGSVFTKVSLDTVGLDRLEVEMAFTNGVRGTPDEGSTAGDGLGFDAGIQYAWGENSDGGFAFQLGVSLSDIGSLRLNETAELHRFTRPDDLRLSATDYEFLTDDIAVDSAIRQLNLDIFGVAGVSLVDRAFTIGLPTSLSAQFSYRPTEDWQIAAFYAGDLNSRGRRLTRGSQLTLASHYGRWWFGGGVTASLYEWENLEVGLQLRLGPVYFVTNRLFGSLLPAQRLNAGDFQLGLRIHDFSPNRRTQRNRKRGKAVECYSF